ncbi:hypothetical protein CEN49_21770 [Fischerella thermalis CCMEE 5273]|nr:hypothetical protein CEN49_21770 [Fischerella thermalis CCMEE 5273]
MITHDNLPDVVQKSVEQYKKKNEVYDVFPAKIIINDISYYYFMYLPSNEQLFVQENGVVPRKIDIEKIIIIANDINSTIEKFSVMEKTWGKQPLEKRIYSYKRLINKAKNILGKSDKKTIDFLNSMIDIIVREQRNIMRCISDAKEMTRKMRKNEYVTIKDQKRYRDMLVSAIESAIKQNNEQIARANQRKELIKLARECKKVTCFIVYLRLKRFNKYFIEPDHPDVEFLRELEKNIVKNKDTPIEKLPDAKVYLRRIRNP